MLNSFMPETFDKIWADLKVKPWPAWTSNPSLLPKSTAFLILLISALSIFPDAKRLQDRSINGLIAILPYIFAIPLQFYFVPEFLMQIYIICMWVLKAYVFVNTGVLKGVEGTNKYGDLDDFKS